MPTLFKEAEKAATALKHASQADPRKNQQLFSSEGFFELVINIRQSTTLPKSESFKYLPLKHKLWDEDVEVCFLCKERRARFKKLTIGKVPNVKKVLGIPRIKSKFSTHHLRKQLRESFPLFVADRAIYVNLLHYLGASLIFPHYIHIQ